MVRGSPVPLSVYESAQGEVKRLFYKLGQLEVALKEKEEVLRAKDELIEELRRRIEERKLWWSWW